MADRAPSYGGQAEEACRLNQPIIAYSCYLSIVIYKWVGYSEAAGMDRVVSGKDSRKTRTLLKFTRAA